MAAFIDRMSSVSSRPSAPYPLLLSAAMALGDVLFVTDEQWRILDANAAASALVGLSPEGLPGQPLALCVRPVGDGVLSAWLEAVAVGPVAPAGPVVPPFEFTAGDGTRERVYEVRLQTGQATDGTPFRTVQLCDVTTRALAARESARRLRGVLEASLDALMIARAHRATDGSVERVEMLEVNARAADLLTRAPDALYPGGDDGTLWAHCGAVLAAGEPLETTQHAPTPDQPLRWVQRRVVPMPADGLVIASRDITRYRLEQLALEESDARLRALFEHNGAIQLLADVDTARLVDANPAAVAFYGWPRDTMRAMYLTDLDVVSTATASAPGPGLRREHRVATGDPRRVALFGSVVLIAGRRVQHLIVQDLTGRVHGEEAPTLEAIGQLAGGIAHDLNNQLTVIRGVTGILREGIGPTSPYVEDLEAIERATARAEALARGLLAMGRRPAP